MTKYLVFLDIDGVFTSTRVQYSSGINEMWSIFDPVAINFMNLIHDKFDDVEFVLISTWKNHLFTGDTQLYHWILSSFRNAGFRGSIRYPLWKTNPENDHRYTNRAYEIKDYLEKECPEYKDFIIFDDNDYGFEQALGVKRFVQTDADNGILWKHMKNAMSLMGTWDPKE